MIDWSFFFFLSRRFVKKRGTFLMGVNFGGEIGGRTGICPFFFVFFNFPKMKVAMNLFKISKKWLLIFK